MELERKEKQRQQQMEDERIENERTETQQEQSIWTKDVASFNWNWVAFIGMCFVAIFIWFGSKPESTPTTNNPPATVTSVPTQSVPQVKPVKDNKMANQQNIAFENANPLNISYAGYEHLFPELQPEAKPVAPQTTPQDIRQRADNLYDQGRYAEAFSLYQGLAEQGSPAAQNLLGLMYNDGQGVAQDYNQAVVWYHKAADQGFSVAQYDLGNMYANGRGVAKDEAQAVAWYRKAAEQGFAMAQGNLGFMYYYGKGVTQDYNQAVYWYRKAAEQGDANAIAALKKLGQ
jgi:hypothetical protein